MTSGVYLITCVASGKVYVGSSTNVEKRWGIHRECLERGDHHCAHLQSAWNKHGAAAFTMDLLEETTRLRDVEQFYIDAARGPLLMNGSLSAHHPVMTEDGLRRLSKSCLASWESEERRNQQSEKMKAAWARDPSRKTRLRLRNETLWTPAKRQAISDKWTDEKRQAISLRPRVNGRLV